MSEKTTYILEMTDRRAFRPKRPPHPELQVRQMELPFPELNWFFEQLIGTDYRWGGRQHWGRDEWASYVNRPALETWLGYLSGTPIGYFELEKQRDGSVHIHRFGLHQPFIGRGLGGHLLTAAVERGWELATSRVWLSTCSHDHPHALRNYEARGFRVVKRLTGLANPPRKSPLFRGPPKH